MGTNCSASGVVSKTKQLNTHESRLTVTRHSEKSQYNSGPYLYLYFQGGLCPALRQSINYSTMHNPDITKGYVHVNIFKVLINLKECITSTGLNPDME